MIVSSFRPAATTVWLDSILRLPSKPHCGDMERKIPKRPPSTVLEAGRDAGDGGGWQEWWWWGQYLVYDWKACGNHKFPGSAAEQGQGCLLSQQSPKIQRQPGHR